MMDLVVNGAAVKFASRGIRRYFENIEPHLEWPTPIKVTKTSNNQILSRAMELLYRGSPKSIFWSPAQRGSITAQNQILTIHDCINIEYVYKRDWRRSVYIEIFNTILNNASAIVAISHATKSAILRNYRIQPDRITVIQSGLGLIPRSPASEQNSSEIMDNRPFILMVTNPLAHKNTLLASKALANSALKRKGVELVVVGALSEEAIKVCQKSGFRLTVFPQIEDTLLHKLYNSCLFLFSPSLEEGHNLTITEALQFDANVICSDIPVHHEFFEDLVLFSDPRSLDSMVAAINWGLENQKKWFNQLNISQARTFVDVARDYRNLFINAASNTQDNTRLMPRQ